MKKALNIVEKEISSLQFLISLNDIGGNGVNNQVEKLYNQLEGMQQIRDCLIEEIFKSKELREEKIKILESDVFKTLESEKDSFTKIIKVHTDSDYLVGIRDGISYSINTLRKAK